MCQLILAYVRVGLETALFGWHSAAVSLTLNQQVMLAWDCTPGLTFPSARAKTHKSASWVSSITVIAFFAQKPLLDSPQVLARPQAIRRLPKMMQRPRPHSGSFEFCSGGLKGLRA